jgi:Domain of unknown function (DUF6371)
LCSFDAERSMFQLEKYRGRNSRYTCPSCRQHNQFSRYVNDNGEYLSEDVGRCNRESKCGYHLPPNLYFTRNNYQSMGQQGFKPKNRPQSLKTINKLINRDDCIDIKFLNSTLANYQNNAFVQFLLDCFPNKFDAIQTVLQDYLVGTWKDNRTVFWQIDQKYKIRSGKIIAFNQQTCKRAKTVGWIHYELKRTKHISNDFQLRQCCFGEHLLQDDLSKPIAIVEAEKTAIIASIYFPELLWFSIGGKSFLTLEKLSQFKSHKIILFPDADGYSNWLEKAVVANRNGIDVSVSDLIEKYATAEEKANGYDLADYLIKKEI